MHDHSRSPSRLRAFVLGGLVGAAAITLGLAAPRSAYAYLMMVRQGQEAPEVPNASDWLGWAVAAGDFDGDGYDDLATGCPGENEGVTPHEHGAVVVNYGSARGITRQSSQSQFLTVGDIDDTIVHYGIALAAGNFNNDAYDDLAVGLPDFDGALFTVASSGAVWVHLGGPTGLGGVPIVIEQNMAGDALEAFDRFGAAVTTGDFNLDGYDDLAAGSPGEDGESGAVFVFRGGPGGIAAVGTVVLRPLFLGSTPEAGGRFGAALAGGNLYDSAHEDLAIGAPQRDVGGMADAGQVYVARGSATGIQTTGSLRFDYLSIGIQNQADSEFGASLAIGHFLDSALGPNQLAVGEPGRIDCYAAQCDPAGRVSVLRQFTPPFAPAFVTHIRQGDSGSPEEAELGDRFGHAVAAGDWDDDGFDDLAVGAPGEDIEDIPVNGLSTTAAGQVFLWLGGPDLGDASTFAGRFHGRTLNDTLETSAQIGWALAFGRFDDSGRANLAIGAPTKDFRNYLTGANTNSAGQVYVLAPWRQISNRPNRASVALDCNGQIVYGQRPFQSIPPASVTKAMTVLLACEAIQNADVDSNYVYTVPDWVADKVSGSSAGLTEGQQIRFVDLMKLAISISAGDACYSIGDILTGGGHVWNGLDGTLPGFNTMMNVKADAIGMNQSVFNNPSGRPLVGHFQTAYDWALLAQYAMANPLFRYFAGTREWADIPNWPVKVNGWLSDMQDDWPPPTADGVKPGSNSLGLKTGLWSAEDPQLGRYEVSAFGIPSTKYGAPFSDILGGTGHDLLRLSLGSCTPGFVMPPAPPDPTPSSWGHFMGIPTGPGVDPIPCFLLPLGDPEEADAQIEIYPQDVSTPTAAFDLTIWRTSEIVLGPGESATLSITPVDAHLGFKILNVLRTTANLMLTTSEPATSTPVALGSEAIHVVQQQGSLTGPYSLEIQNTSSTAGVRLQVDEQGYEVAGTVGGRGPFVVQLERDPHQSEEVIKVCVGPGDPGPGNLVYLVVRPPGATVDVGPQPPGPWAATAPGVRLRAAVPNPFSSATALAYELKASGPVWMTLHDLAGRTVRTFESGAWRPAGQHTSAWDGRDHAGRTVAPGIYFQRVRTTTGRAEQRIVRVR